jgi:hypothetical protein
MNDKEEKRLPQKWEVSCIGGFWLTNFGVKVQEFKDLTSAVRACDNKRKTEP